VNRARTSGSVARKYWPLDHKTQITLELSVVSDRHDSIAKHIVFQDRCKSFEIYIYIYTSKYDSTFITWRCDGPGIAFRSKHVGLYGFSRCLSHRVWLLLLTCE
jgi:hypothetical protein